MRVAFATYAKQPELSPAEAKAATALKAFGILVEAPRWDDSSVDWKKYDAVLPRSTWDYHERPDEFQRWLTQLEAANVRVLNDQALIRWNINKLYLKELEEAGVPIVPTYWHGQGQDERTRLESIESALLKADPASEWILKPVVSAGAYYTLRLRAGDVVENLGDIAALSALGPVMRQPYLPEISSRGEWSLIFFDGRFSFAVLKKPKAGDFRVQEMYGGETSLATPTPRLIETAAKAVQSTPIATDYARADLVELDSGPALMELELIEPSLYFEYAPNHSIQEFARVVRNALVR